MPLKGGGCSEKLQEEEEVEDECLRTKHPPSLLKHLFKSFRKKIFETFFYFFNSLKFCLNFQNLILIFVVFVDLNYIFLILKILF